MATMSFTDIVKSSYGHPSILVEAISDHMAEISNGNMIVVDPNNSVAIMMEAITSVGAGTLLANLQETRRIYKSGANSYADIYRHMSDEDYKNRFAQPARDIPFIIMLDLQTLINRAVVIPNTNGRRKITIPAQSTIEASGYPFTTEYPIDIIVLPHGAISVLQDNTLVSPLKSLKSNRLGWTTIQDKDGTYLAVNIPMDQFAINRKVISLSSMSSFKQEFSYTDNYYYCRAYMRATETSKWVEISTTHQDEVYDPAKPTVCLRVLNNTVVAMIPQIYFNNQSIGTDVRLDFYTTKGPIDVDLSTYAAKQYKLTWKEIDDPDVSVYVSPLKDFQKLAISSTEHVVGGSNGATFTDLRNRVIGRVNDTPVNEKNLPVKAALTNYNIVLKKDNVSNRTFVATRDLPAPTTADTVTGMDTALQPLLTRFSDLVASSSVVNANKRVVIRPGMLFRVVNGILDIVPDTERADLFNPAIYPPERLVTTVNNQRFLYNPFHYVIDKTSRAPSCRAYVMNKPTINFVNFVQDNDSAGITLSPINRAVWLRNDNNGYIIAVQIDPSTFPSDVTADQIGVQLSHKIVGSEQRIYYHGYLTQANDEDMVIDAVDPNTNRPYNDAWVYYFFINSNLEVDDNDNLTTNGYSGALGILDDLDVVYYTKDYRDHVYQETAIDSLLYPKAIPNYNPASLYSGLTHEKLTIQFGEHLKHLWTRARVVDDTTEYETYSEDVPDVYTTDVFELIPGTKTVKMKFNTTTGKYERTLLHSAGDIVTNPLTNETLYKHRKGEYVLDDAGQYIAKAGILNPIREIDLFLLDGSYCFATDVTTLQYRAECEALLAEWITGEVSDLSENFYGGTDLFFYPKRNMGYVKVTVGNGNVVSIPAEQKLSVTYFVTSTVKKNTTLTDSIETATAGVIDSILQNTTISLSDITKALRIAFIDHVLEVKVTGLFEDAYEIVTVADESIRPSISKQLKLTRSQTLMVTNGIDVKFELHSN